MRGVLQYMDMPVDRIYAVCIQNDRTICRLQKCKYSVRDLLATAETGADQIHVAAHRSVFDRSVENNRAIFFGGCLYPPEDRFSLIDREIIGGIAAKL